MAIRTVEGSEPRGNTVDRDEAEVQSWAIKIGEGRGVQGGQKLESRKKARVPGSFLHILRAGGTAQKWLAGSKCVIEVDHASPKVCL